jgi:hypothetical protein
VILNCTQCHWCVLEYYGYSDYTITNIDFTCLKTERSLSDVEGWQYRKDKAAYMGYSAKCPLFQKGYAVAVQVEDSYQEVVDRLDSEQANLFRQKFKEEL